MPDQIVTIVGKSGKTYYLPTIELVQELDDDGDGFCIACGNVVDCLEPDAGPCECPECGERKAYGAAELALRGLTR